MQVWAIRRKGTEMYLPSRREGKRVVRAGFTWDEPIEGGGEYGPRFFYKKVSAERALAAWLKGVWKNVMEGDWDELYPTVARVEPREPPTPRRLEDMEVVGFDLVPILPWAGNRPLRVQLRSRRVRG